MGNTVAKITSQIVKFTGNPDTKAFVGKIVTRKNTDTGIRYVIGSTGYALSAAEYRMFVEAGAIAQSSLLPKSATKKSASAVKESTKTEKHEKAEKKATAEHARTKKTASALVEAEEIQTRADFDMELGSEEHSAMLETSEFLMNYPKPSFDLDTPKHMGFFDKKDDFKERATGFFDRIGRAGRDKLVHAMTQE